MNYTGPKVRNSRKIGVPMTAKAGRIMSSDKAGRKSPPGQHGSTKRRGKLSVYGTQIFEKQKLRLQYNIHERQMTNYYKKASHLTGNTGDILLHMLETRLDAMIFRSGLARSMASARQYVNHGHFLVNGKPVNIPSYQVKVNDVVTVRLKSRKMEAFQESIRTAAPPVYLTLSKADFSVKFLHLPAREEVPVICEIPLVIEFYSR